MIIELQNISINHYCNLLRSGVDVELLTSIDSELSQSIGNAANGFDLALFMLQKDLLIFQCKAAKSWFEYNFYLQEIHLQKLWFDYYGFDYTFDEIDNQETKKLKEKAEIWNKKIAELQEQIAKKTVKKERGNPYQSFLAWILAVEKFLSFAIDKNNDLLYFAEATKQMINYYEAQKANIEQQNSKKK